MCDNTGSVCSMLWRIYGAENKCVPHTHIFRAKVCSFILGFQFLQQPLLVWLKIMAILPYWLPQAIYLTRHLASAAFYYAAILLRKCLLVVYERLCINISALQNL